MQNSEHAHEAAWVTPKGSSDNLEVPHLQGNFDEVTGGCSRWTSPGTDCEIFSLGISLYSKSRAWEQGSSADSTLGGSLPEARGGEKEAWKEGQLHRHAWQDHQHHELRLRLIGIKKFCMQDLKKRTFRSGLPASTVNSGLTLCEFMRNSM